MKYSVRSVLHLAVGLVLLSAAGCTGTDVLNTNSGDFRVTITTANPPAEFESVGISVSQITLSPADPAAAAALGAFDLGILDEPLLIDISDILTGEAAIPATAGSYRLVSVQLQQVFLRDADPPEGEATCEEYVQLYQYIGAAMFLTDFGRDVIVTIENGGEGALSLSVDLEALADAFVGAHVCQQNCFVNFQVVPWCLVGFDPDAFTSESPTFLNFD